MPTRYEGTPVERRALNAFIKLLRAAHWLSRSADRTREAVGLTEAQFGVLEALLHVGPSAQTTLADKLLTSTSNLTVVLDNLERDGLITRQRSLEDRRQRLVRLSKEGRKLIERIFPSHVTRITEAMSVLSPEEQEELGRLCRKLGVATEKNLADG